MDAINQNLKELSARIPKQLEYAKNEEATKTALIQPFIEALGYDVSDLRDVEPEYTCDFPGKKGKKVDYAINKRDEKPFMVFECKSATEILKDIHADQLHFYFYYNKARFAVLTNGVMYKFYTDLEKSDRMDVKPFLEFDVRDMDNTLAEKLKGFRKESSDEPDPEKLRYTEAIKRIFESELNSPSDKFVKFFIAQVYSGRATKNVRKRFKGIIQGALGEFIDEKFKDRLKPVIEPKIVTTEEELEGLDIVREITNIDRVDLNDTENHCNVILDENTQKLICRFYFDHEPKYVGFFDHGAEDKVPIGDLSDLRKYAGKLKATVSYHDGVKPFPPPDTKTMQLEFWNGFKAYVQSKSTSLRLRQKTHPQHWYAINLRGPKAQIYLSINTQSNVLTCEIYISNSKELFNGLVKHKDEIEDELNETLEWMELPDKTASRIKFSKSGNIKEPDEREEQFEWLKTQAELFQKVFPKYIR